MDKTLELKKINEEMEADKNLPLVKKSEDVIPGEGNPDAKVMFIGEAGGYHESVQRKPFVGNAGKLLDSLLQSIRLPREDVYITNMVKTRPPDNRDPFPEELKAFEKYLNKEIKIINPEVIVTLGRYSMAKFLPLAKIGSVHGRAFRVEWKDRKTVVVPMYHPAAGLRSTEVKKKTEFDFQKLGRLLEKLFKVNWQQTTI